MRKQFTLFLTVFCLAAVVAVPARAELITNGSFESGSYTDNHGGGMSLPVGSSNITGWTVVSGELAWLNNSNPYGGTTPYGSYFLDLTGYHDSSPYGGVSQTIATAVGQTYTLSFAVGYIGQSGIYGGPVAVQASAGSASQTFTTGSSGTGPMWTTYTMNFTATSPSTVIQLIGTLSTGGQYIGLDNVSVVEAAAVPEPAGLVMAGVAAVGVGLAAFRRRRAGR